ncbi:MAG: hypothetical protein QM778_18635 [Myxococcales bacterium]
MNRRRTRATAWISLITRPRHWLLTCLLFSSAAACGHPEAPLKTFEVKPDPDPASLGYPANDAGTFTLLGANGLEIRIDPEQKTPVNTMRACRGWLRECRKANPGRFDQCVAEAPDCKNERPWEHDEQCCPHACGVQYEALRKKGQPYDEAWLAVIEQGDCFPGFVAYSEGKQP